MIISLYFKWSIWLQVELMTQEYAQGIFFYNLNILWKDFQNLYLHYPSDFILFSMLAL